MKKFGAYKIVSDKEMNIEYYRGEITIEDLISFKKKLHSDPDYNRYWSTIADLRDCKLIVKSSEFSEFINFMKTGYDHTKSRSIALISSRPNDVAISTMYSLLVKESGLNFTTYLLSAIDSVVNSFCNNLFTEEELNAILKGLKTSTNNIYT